jgi:putative PIN family toxin of toxin-antitoxin system
MKKIVIDTNVFISAILGRDGSYARLIVEAVFDGALIPLMGEALFNEYWDVLTRDALFKNSPLNREERETLLASFLSCCEWTKIYFKWRPNLKDEKDNHVMELAVAGGAGHIVTQNIRDLVSGELEFSGLEIVTPEMFVKEAKWEQ